MSQISERTPRTSPRLDDRSARSAQIRAIAARLVDSPHIARRFHVPAGVPLTGSPRSRSSGRRAAPRVDATRKRSPVVRRVVVLAVLAVQVVGLIVLFTAPAFKVHTVDLNGTQLLSRTALLQKAAVPTTSVFAVDSNAIRNRLSSVPWVENVSVSTQLPSTVVIDVTEWTPDIVYHSVTGTSFVASNGASLAVDSTDVARVKSYPIAVDERTAPPGLAAGMPDLLAAVAQRWHGLFNTDVAAFAWSSGGILSIWSADGWAAIIGSTDTSQQVAAIPDEISALAALRGKVSFIDPTFGYISLEEPSQPAIGGQPGIPADIQAALTAASTVPVTPTPAPVQVPHPAASASSNPTSAATTSPAPTATPAAPTAPPSPTPITFVLPPPSPTPRGAG